MEKGLGRAPEGGQEEAIGLLENYLGSLGLRRENDPRMSIF
jgi:hypothetical protein